MTSQRQSLPEESASQALGPIPATMKAAVATGFGDVDANVELRTDWPTPRLSDPAHVAAASADGKAAASDLMLIKVLSCALAPGDVRVLSGKTARIQLPAGGHPYVVGSDVAGVVVEVHPDEAKFRVGDYVASRFDEPKPNGGVAEYRLVKTALSERCPDGIRPGEACGLPASYAAARRVCVRYVREGDRVLVVGAGGGVGCAVVQYAKRVRKAAFVVGVTTQSELARELGADEVVDYRSRNWWEVPEYQTTKFDVVIDLVNGNNWTEGACSGLAVKPGAPYVQLLTGVETEFEFVTTWDLVKLTAGMIGRKLRSALSRRLPRWEAPEALKLEEGDLREVLRDVAEGRIRPVLDPSSPFPFTEGGVRDAMRLQKSKHAHGKVVVEIAGKRES